MSEEVNINGRTDLAGVVAADVSTFSGQAIIYQRRGDKVEELTYPFLPWVVLRDPTVAADQMVLMTAEVQHLDGDGAFKFLVKTRPTSQPNDYKAFETVLLSALKRRFKIEGKRTLWDMRNDGHLVMFNQEEQFLLDTEITFFNDMEFDDPIWMAVDIETYQTDPGIHFTKTDEPENRIISIQVATNKGDRLFIARRAAPGKTKTVEELATDEAEILNEFIEVVREIDPDIILGHNILKFDMPFIVDHCRMHSIQCALGRKGAVVGRRWIRRFKIGAQNKKWPFFTIPGRQLIDTYLVAQDLAERDKNLKQRGCGLKQCAVYAGVASPDRVYLSGDKIGKMWTEGTEEERNQVEKYAMDDVDEELAIRPLLLGHSFSLARMVPAPFERVVGMGTASMLDKLMTREYLHAGHAIPAPQSKSKSYEGGIAEALCLGVFQDIIKCDFESLYPTIMLKFGHMPESDVLGVLGQLLDTLRTLRLKHKKLMKEASSGSAEKLRHKSMQSAFKILINSAYGMMGSQFSTFNDPHAAALVTAKGRELLKAVTLELEQHGCKVIEIDTDGAYFTRPKGAKKEAQVSKFIQEVGAAVSSEVTLAFDGAWSSMYCTGAKNYALLDSDGKVTLKGASLRSTADEPAIAEARAAMLRALLEGKPEEIQRLYRDMYVAIHDRSLPTSRLVKRINQKKTIEEYDKKLESKGTRQPHMEALRCYGGPERFPVGAAIPYYIADKGGRRQPDYMTATVFTSEPTVPDYDIPTYIKKVANLKQRFKVAFFPEDHEKIFSSKGDLLPAIKPLARKVRSFGTDSRWKEVCYGAKKRKKPIRNKFSCDEDTVARDELIDNHGDDDLHESPLAAYGSKPRKSKDLSHRVRSGDFYGEFECKHYQDDNTGATFRDLSLPVAKAALRLLTSEYGLDAAKDIRFYYNGNHDIYVRIRQSAFGMPDVLGLEKYWRRFAEHLDQKLREDLQVTAALTAAGASPEDIHVLDLHMYSPTSLLRVINTKHHATGRYNVPITAFELSAATKIEGLHQYAQAPRDEEVPIEATGHTPALKEVFDTLTQGMKRQETYDPNAKYRSEQAKKQATRRAAKAIRRARKLSDPVVPCADRILGQIDGGDSIGFIPYKKLLWEGRHIFGMSNDDMARALVTGGGGEDRYVSGGRVEQDLRPDDELNPCGWRVPESHWPENEDDQIPVACSHPEIVSLCSKDRCYRSPEMATYDEAGSPTFDEFQQQGRDKLTTLLEEELPANSFVLAQATMRSGKTWNMTRKAAERANDDQKSWIVVPNHGVALTAVRYAREQKILAQDKLMLHVFGKRQETCAKEDNWASATCSGCKYALKKRVKQGDETKAIDNPSLAGLLAASHQGIYGLKELKALAKQHDLCVRTVTWALASKGRADVLVIPHAYLAQDVAREILPVQPPPDYIYVDEADQLTDNLQGESIKRLYLSGVRNSPKRSLREGTCSDNCDKCHIEFVNRYHDHGFDVDTQLGSVDEGAEPRRLIELLERGALLLSRLEGGAYLLPGIVDVKALSENVALLKDCLIHPVKLGTPGEHQPPKKYLESLGTHLTSDAFLAKNPRVQAIPGIKEHVALIFDPCIGPVDDDEEVADGEEEHTPKDFWRIDFGRIVMKRYFNAEFMERKMKELGADDTEAINAILRFGLFTTSAAQRSSGAVLGGVWRPWEGADFIPSCRLVLQYCEAARFRCVQDLLAKSRAVLLSGTLLDRRLAAHSFLLHDQVVDYRSLDVPMHKMITVLQHNVDPECEDLNSPMYVSVKTFGVFVRSLVKILHKNATPLPGKIWPRILVFCKSRRAAGQFIYQAKSFPANIGIEARAKEQGLIKIREMHGQEEGGVDSCNALLAIDYLRSSGSRGVDRTFYDVVVGYGNGYPDFSGYTAYLKEVNNVSGEGYRVETFAEYNRNRTYWQAMLRAASDGSRPRVIVTISDSGVQDVPTFMLNRRLTAADLYSSIKIDEDDKPSDIVVRQMSKLAKEVANLLQGGSPQCAPTTAQARGSTTEEDSGEEDMKRLEDALLYWNGRQGSKTRTASEKKLDYVFKCFCNQGFIRKGQGPGKRKQWLEFLNWLAKGRLVEQQVFRRSPARGTEEVKGGRKAVRYLPNARLWSLLVNRWRRTLPAEVMAKPGVIGTPIKHDIHWEMMAEPAKVPVVPREAWAYVTNHTKTAAGNSGGQ